MGRRKSNAQIERETLEGFAADVFNKHKGRYSYRHINRELRREGILASNKRVLHAMQKLGLIAKDAAKKHRADKRE